MLVEVNGLGKKYDKKKDFTIKNISLKGDAGEIVGILGHNGAGKSTTIKCLTGMHPYDEGEIIICGHNLKNNAIEAKKNFGYVSDEFTLFEKMTGYEYVNFLADVYNVTKEQRKERITHFQTLFMLGDAIYNPISTYSHGMKQKISFMAALIHNPKIVILDEPFIGLDPFTMSQVKAFFQDYSKQGNLILFSSHDLNTVQHFCNRAYIIDQGALLEEINFNEFKQTNTDFQEYFLSITKRVSKS
ncbi:MAG: ABC transporter ATP-binding protein [Clostridia bacterium]|nr:ABC transporter ATP-binding protein [Clostridia bacterium]